MKRICIIGCCGAGKSTFAKQISAALSLPLIHMDTLFWTSGWREQNKAIFDANLTATLSKDRWITDGHYTRTLEKRIERADTIFMFDFPTRICLLRLIKRLLQYRGQTRPDMAEQCPERIDWGLIKYMLSFRHLKRPPLMALLNKNAARKTIIIFKHPKDVQHWIDKNLCSSAVIE